MYEVLDSKGVKILRGNLVLNKVFGSFDLNINLPENINLGDTSLQISGDHKELKVFHKHTFQVEEVRYIFFFSR